MDFLNDKNERYRFKMVDVYNEQIKDLIKIVPDFKIANATVHFDEVSPHMHIVGVLVVLNCTRGMKKQKGRNQDINVNEMGNYREIKKQLKQEEQKLEKANNQTKQIDNSSKDINTILDNLKPTLMNKNNMVISSEDVQKIKNYTKDVKI
mgnify:CR=1 FL=1